MERRNMVQGQTERKTTKATNYNTGHDRQSIACSQPTATRVITTEEEIYREEARETGGDGNKQ